ncbi:50S ribosomal protein L18a [Candidatus Bathyarchaeota archaeon]|nr:MAG: 50S ribosomal protein L18a [Candidatus Bathyarchaeota archaeon]
MNEWIIFQRNEKMVEVKIFRVEGEILSPNYKTTFSKDIRAVKPEHAVEKVYMELGSQHKVKRMHMKLYSIKEITEEETENLLIKELSRE